MTADEIEEYLRLNDDVTTAELAGELMIPPEKAKEVLETRGESVEVTPAEHYNRVADVYQELGEIDGNYCIGNSDFIGWYRTRDTPGAGDGEGRGWALGREWPLLRDDVERVVYAAINYTPAEWFVDAWQPYEYNQNGRSWDGDDTPLPGYGDLTCYAPFADIDLTDEVKKERPEGEIPRDDVEEALQKYIDAFAGLAGGEEHVFALDSVGGAYVMIAPTATRPIAERFDAEARGKIFEDLTGRMNDWLGDVRKSVNNAVDVEGVFEPDELNNKNRLFKAPMSVHSSLDGVVTPMDTSQPEYAFTSLQEVRDDDVTDAVEWSDGYTADHREAVDGVVCGLWPDYYADADDWEAALRDALEDMEEEEEKHEQRELDRLDPSDVPDDVEATDEFEIVEASLEGIDVRDVARDVSSEWDTAPGRDPTRFAPSWRTTKSGTSCYADRDKFVDLAEGKNGGGAVKLVARARGIIRHSSDTPKGEDFWQAVNELRKLGYKIPYFKGNSGTHPDYLQLYDEPESEEDARRQAVRAMRASQRSG